MMLEKTTGWSSVTDSVKRSNREATQQLQLG